MLHCCLQSATAALAEVSYKTHTNKSCALNQTYRENLRISPKNKNKSDR
jgi:transcriptional regulator GlxA family with amidase domain